MKLTFGKVERHIGSDCQEVDVLLDGEWIGYLFKDDYAEMAEWCASGGVEETLEAMPYGDTLAECKKRCIEALQELEAE